MARSQVDKQQKQTLSAPYIETLTNANDELLGMKFSYNIHGKRIAVMVSYDAPTQYDQRDTSVPGKYLHRYEEAGWRSDGAKTSDNAEKRLNAITEEIQRLVDDTCYKILMEIAGPPPTALLPRTKVESNEGVVIEHKNIKPTLHHKHYTSTCSLILSSYSLSRRKESSKESDSMISLHLPGGQRIRTLPHWSTTPRSKFLYILHHISSSRRVSCSIPGSS